MIEAIAKAVTKAAECSSAIEKAVVEKSLDKFEKILGDKALDNLCTIDEHILTCSCRAIMISLAPVGCCLLVAALLQVILII